MILIVDSDNFWTRDQTTLQNLYWGGHDLRRQNRDKTKISASDEHQCSANTSHNIGRKSLVETPDQS